MNDRLKKLLELLQESEKDAFILFAVAKEYEKLNQLDLALNHYQRLYMFHPDYVGLYYHWGKLLEELDDAKKAIEIYKLGIDVSVKQNDKHAEKELRAAKYNSELLL